MIEKVNMIKRRSNVLESLRSVVGQVLHNGHDGKKYCYGISFRESGR